MKSLNYNELEEDCTEFGQTFSLDDASSDVISQHLGQNEG
jgi:hypothetical protein